jgi:hypothetical protein
MKTAILISGHMRSFARCLPNQADQVFRHFAEADFFVSTVKDEDCGTAELLRERFPRARVEIEVIDCQPEIPIPVPPASADWQAGQNRLYTHEPYALSVHPQAVLRQLWHLDHLWTRYAEQLTAYDCFVRSRPDLYFRSFAPSHTNPLPATAFVPWWGRFGGINDRFAILGHKAVEAYFTTFSRIGDLLAKGYPLHPERLIYASLTEAGCFVDDTLRAEFSKLIWDRGPQHGHFRDPEISPIDIAHLAASRT